MRGICSRLGGQGELPGGTGLERGVGQGQHRPTAPCCFGRAVRDCPASTDTPLPPAGSHPRLCPVFLQGPGASSPSAHMGRHRHPWRNPPETQAPGLGPVHRGSGLSSCRRTLGVLGSKRSVEFCTSSCQLVTLQLTLLPPCSSCWRHSAKTPSALKPLSQAPRRGTQAEGGKGAAASGTEGEQRRWLFKDHEGVQWGRVEREVRL